MGAKKESTDMPFETAMNRLEKIVEEMESGKLTLEQLLLRYEEGLQLSKVCAAKLDAAEKRIKLVTQEASGNPSLAPFSSSENLTAAAMETKAPTLTENPKDDDEVSLF